MRGICVYRAPELLCGSTELSCAGVSGLAALPGGGDFTKACGGGGLETRYLCSIIITKSRGGGGRVEEEREGERERAVHTIEYSPG